MVSRLERTPFAAWWWTVDRLLLAALFALMLCGIVLSLERMNRIKEIDASNRFAVVEPGVVLWTLHEECRKHGLLYPIDMSSGGSCELGGKVDDLHGYSIPIEAEVLRLSDGHFVYEGPMNGGNTGWLGRTAVLACKGRHGNIVEVIVSERRVQALDTAIFRSQGIEPKDKQIVVVKSAVHFRGAFAPIAAKIIEVDTPGLLSIDLSRFDYERINRPMWPLDR